MSIRKVFYIVIGSISLGLGAIGAFLPLLPAIPFLLLAAFCFARGSEKLHVWFTNTELYKNNLESFVNGKGMTLKTKLKVIMIVTACLSYGFAMMYCVLAGRIILMVVWLFHIFYFTFGVKTISKS